MNEFPVVLVINCGSSSIKFSVLDASDCEVLMSVLPTVLTRKMHSYP